MFKFVLVILSLVLASCTEPRPQNISLASQKLSVLLEAMLKTLPYKVKSKNESQKLAKDIFYYTKILRKKFKRNSSPLFHNFLVNIHLKEKGLCYHWSDALYLHLSSQKYKYFKFHLVGANIGKYWTEHNALVVIAKGDKIENGILIDPWRELHRLYFGKITEDKKYQWTHRSKRCCLQQLR